ncbi:MAG TPA: glycosyl hydrolase [Solirubrobacterales bacterium]
MLALVGCLLLLALPATASAKRTASHPLYWGAWIGDQITGEEPPWDMQAVTKFEQKMGKGLSLIEFSAPLAECGSGPCSFSSFPTDEMQRIREYGAIPVLSWNTGATPTSTEMPDFQLADIYHHSYDRYLKAFAREAAEWGHPFFLRFDWEMNGNWFPWAEGANGNKPGDYVKAWRHVHDIFAAAGATNASWVWCPYANTEGALGKFPRYYPGNKYVDWTCMDAYNFGTNRVNPRPWQSFDALFRPTYRELTEKVAPGKPVMLGEIASNGPGAQKASWIRGMFKSIARSYPKVGALVWFDHFDRGLRWPLEIEPGPTAAFRAGLRRNPFLGPEFGALDESPIPMPH